MSTTSDYWIAEDLKSLPIEGPNTLYDENHPIIAAKLAVWCQHPDEGEKGTMFINLPKVLRITRAGQDWLDAYNERNKI